MKHQGSDLGQQHARQYPHAITQSPKKEILNFPAHVNKESFFGGEKANVSSCFFFLRSLQNFLKKKKITGKNITKMQMVGVKR